jgi:hypothetical protein
MIVFVIIPSSEDFGLPLHTFWRAMTHIPGLISAHIVGNTEALDRVKKEAGVEARCIGVVTKCDLVIIHCVTHTIN